MTVCGPDNPTFVVAYIAHENRSLLLPPVELAAFLQKHDSLDLVCFDAGTLRWRLQDILLGAGKVDAIKLLLLRIRDRRWFDVQQLDRQVRTSKGLVAPLRPFERILDESPAPHPPVATPVQDSQPSGACDEAINVARVFEWLYDELEDAYAITLQDLGDLQHPPEKPIVESTEWSIPFPEFLSDQGLSESDCDPILEEEAAPPVEKPSWLELPNDPAELRRFQERLLRHGHAVQIRRAIVESNLKSKRMHLDPHHWQDFREWCQQLYQTRCNALRRDRKARKAFEWDGPLVKISAQGRVISNDGHLRRWLDSCLKRLVDVRGFPINIPRTDEDQLPLNSIHWTWIPFCDPLLAAWADLHALASVLAVPAECPIWSGELCVSSNVGGLLKRWPKPLLRPQEKHKFIVVHLSDFRSRCFAAICQEKGYALDGRLWGHIFSPSYDFGHRIETPHGRLEDYIDDHYPAERLPSLATERSLLVQKFLALSWLPIVDESLTVYLHETEDCKLDAKEVCDLRIWLADHVAYELEHFLGDFPEEIAARLRIRLDEMPIKLGYDRDSFSSRSLSRYFWNRLVDGGSAASELISQANTWRRTNGRLPIDSVDGWFIRRGMALAGTITCPAFEIQARAAEVLALADEVRWNLAYHLLFVKHVDLIRVAQDELVLEVSEAMTSEGVMNAVRAECVRILRQFGQTLNYNPHIHVCDEWPNATS